MAFPSCVSTGWDSLDQIIDHLRRGDNVVWQVDNIDDYQRLVTAFVNRALANGERVVYVRFARHLPLVEERGDLVTVHRLDVALGSSPSPPRCTTSSPGRAATSSTCSIPSPTCCTSGPRT